MSTAKNYPPVSLLSVVSKVFRKLVNNRIFDHLEVCDLFSVFQYGFRSSQSSADPLTIVSKIIARASNRSGATWTVALDISKAFDRVWHVGLCHKLNLTEFLARSDCLSSSRVHSWSTLFLLYINELPDDVICNTAIYADDTTLYSKYDQGSDLWQQLESASKLESDLQDTVGWDRKWLVDWVLEKLK